jgi:hypothetical protein
MGWTLNLSQAFQHIVVALFDGPEVYVGAGAFPYSVPTVTVTPAKAGVQGNCKTGGSWIPACAGMTAESQAAWRDSGQGG